MKSLMPQAGKPNRHVNQLIVSFKRTYTCNGAELSKFSEHFTYKRLGDVAFIVISQWTTDQRIIYKTNSRAAHGFVLCGKRFKKKKRKRFVVVAVQQRLLYAETNLSKNVNGRIPRKFENVWTRFCIN